MDKTIRAVAVLILATTGMAAWADGLSSADKSFLDKASNAGHTEVQASTIAMKKSTNADVKSFADEMIRDHMAAGLELTTLASGKGVKIPAEPSVAQQAKIKLLARKTGTGFDRGYVDDIGVKAHKDTVALFKKASTSADDAEIKAWATKTLPTLEHHLSEAQSLQTAMKKNKPAAKAS